MKLILVMIQCRMIDHNEPLEGFNGVNVLWSPTKRVSKSHVLRQMNERCLNIFVKSFERMGEQNLRNYLTASKVEGNFNLLASL